MPITLSKEVRVGDTVYSGQLRAQIDHDMSLRDLAIGDVRALDAIVFASRDGRWGTGDVKVESFVGHQDDRGFSIDFRCRHVNSDIEIDWTGNYTARDGELRASICGTPARRQCVNRAGFSLLHPIEQRGNTVRARTTRGRIVSQFPDAISPVPLFTDMVGMSIDLGHGTSIDVTFEGEVFETEDHRNWTDAGWKTYCTPLSHPPKRVITPADRIDQVLVFRALQMGGGPRRRPTQALRVEVEDVSSGIVPRIGSMASDLPGLAPEVRADVRSLGLDHVGVELVDGDRPLERLSRAVAEARECGVPLRVFLATKPDRLDAWIRTLTRASHPVDVLVAVDTDTNSSTDRLVAGTNAVRRTLDPPMEFAAGTRGYFAELNRLELDLTGSASVCYAICPQVHHFDDQLVMDTLLGQPDTVAGTMARTASRRVHVGPITLRQRLNVHEHPAAPMSWEDGVTGDVDPRQHAPFAAVWALGTVAACVRATSLTIYRTAGRRGIVPGQDTTAVVRSLASLAGQTVQRLVISDPRRVIGLAVKSHTTTVLLLGNRTGDPQEVTVEWNKGTSVIKLQAWEIQRFDMASGIWHAV